MSTPRLIAHRGLRGPFIENSLDSFRAAVGTGADAIEFDIQATKDHKLVVLHSMRSPCSIYGINQPISSLTWHEIKKYRDGNGQPIPTFTEVIEATKGKLVAVDIKDKTAAELLAEQLTERDAKRIMVVNSLHFDALVRLKQKFPALSHALQTYTRPFKTIRRAQEIGASHITIPLYLLNPVTYLVAKRAGLKLLVYQNYVSFFLNSAIFVRLIWFCYPGTVVISDRADKVLPR